MTEPKSYALINLGDLSKPADTLIRKVSKAVGGIFEPYQLKRIAKAESEARIIEAQADIKITEIHHRAMHRLIEEEAQKQKNIEDITSQAIPLLGEQANAEQMNDDWVTNFFDKARIVSDGEMQGLWSRVLAGEANAPGTYSKRTVNFIADLDKSDAEMFTQLCSFAWSVGILSPLIFDIRAVVYEKNGINFGIISHLESIGLIKFDNLADFQRIGLPKRFAVAYYNKPLFLEMPNDQENQLSLGHVLLTKVGQELAPICGSKPVDGFFEFVQEKWKPFVRTPVAAPMQADPNAPQGASQ